MLRYIACVIQPPFSTAAPGSGAVLVVVEERPEVEVLLQKAVELDLAIRGEPVAGIGEQVVPLRKGHDQHVGRRQENQLLDALWELGRVQRRQEPAERMPDQDQTLLAQEPPDPLEVRDLSAEAERGLELLHVGVVVRVLEAVERPRRQAAASLVVVVNGVVRGKRVEPRHGLPDRKAGSAVNKEDRPALAAVELVKTHAALHQPRGRVIAPGGGLEPRRVGETPRLIERPRKHEVRPPAEDGTPNNGDTGNHPADDQDFLDHVGPAYRFRATKSRMPPGSRKRLAPRRERGYRGGGKGAAAGGPYLHNPR
jgi:hypothetical protein